MRNYGRAIMLAGAATLLAAPMVFAQPATDAQFKCEAQVDKAGAKFVGAKSKCVAKCLANAWKGVGPFTDCYPPYAGSTAQCINDTVLGLKGAENKFTAAIRKSCDPTFKAGTECPTCYDSGDCSVSGYATDQVANIEGQVDSFVPGVACEGAGADPLEQKCQTATAKALTKQVAGVIKAYDKCFGNARKGLINASSCAPPASDPATSAAITSVDAKAISGINKACGGECISGNCNGVGVGTTCSTNADCGDQSVKADCSGTDDYPTGSAWVNLVDVAISGNIPNTYCQN